MNDIQNIKYQTRLCDEAMLETLIKFKNAKLEDSQIKFLLNCIGKLYCRCSIDDKPIDYYVEHLMKSLEGDINESMDNQGQKL